MGTLRDGRPLLFLGFVLAVLSVRANAAAAREAWHRPDMPCRLQLSALPADGRGGINTARIDLAEQGELCRPDGADICLTTPSGRAVPHRVDLGENSGFQVVFKVPEDCERFHLYYGSGHAEPVAEGWDEELGGLYLETRPISRRLKSASDLPAAMRQYTKAYDRQPWKQIWDQENPFGPDDGYLSVYEGTLYCPEDGRYVFAVSCDDAAFVGIEDVADPLCWRNPGADSLTWRDPRQPRAVRDIKLGRGIYRLRYCHVENDGGQLAKLGWQPPSSDTIVVVPPDAFVRYLPVEVEGRELRDETLCPFFTADHSYTIKVNGREPGFPRYRFEARMAGFGEEGLQFLWDFGDGTTASGRTVMHEFTTGGTQAVTLTTRDQKGGQASVTRPVRPPAWPTSDIVLRLQVRPSVPVVAPGNVLRLKALVYTQGGAEQEFELGVVSSSDGVPGGGPKGRRHANVTFSGARGGAEKWSECETDFRVEDEDLTIVVAARLHGVEVAREDLVVMGTDAVLRGLYLDGAQELRQADGARVILRTAGATRAGASARCLCEPDSETVNVLVFDTTLGGPRGWLGRDYTGLLADALGTRYAGLTFDVQRAEATEADAGWSPTAGFLHVAATLERTRPNVVILVCQPDAVINGVPMQEFEQALEAALDQVLVRSRAESILVGPPPLPGRPKASREYAAVAKRLGLRKGVAVVDLYSRFLLVEEWEKLFQPEGGAGQTFLLYPNERGQEMIAAEIRSAIVEDCHEGLSAAVRQASFRRSAGEP